MSSQISALLNWFSPQQQQVAGSNALIIPKKTPFDPNNPEHLAIVEEVTKNFELALSEYRPLLMKVGAAIAGFFVSGITLLVSGSLSWSISILSTAFGAWHGKELLEARMTYSQALAKVSETVSWCMQSKVTQDAFNNSAFYNTLRCEPVQELILASGCYLTPEHLNKLENAHLESTWGGLAGSNLKDNIKDQLRFIRGNVYKDNLDRRVFGEDSLLYNVNKLKELAKSTAMKHAPAVIAPTVGLKRD